LFATVAGLSLTTTGCQPQPLPGGGAEFSDWHQELAYLKAQANTTPEQFRRLRELETKEGLAELDRKGIESTWRQRAYAAYVLLTREEEKLPERSRRPDHEVEAQANKETQEARYASESKILDRLRREAEGKPASERSSTEDLDRQAAKEAADLARKELDDISRQEDAEIARRDAESQARREANKKGK
jgi:hypothetical protein